MMAKRGMLIEASIPFLPVHRREAREKVIDLAGIIAGYCGRFRLHIVNLCRFRK
jgi:thiamine biosynthesis protein ThiI